MEIWTSIVIPSIVAVVVSIITIFIKDKLTEKSKIQEEIRDIRRNKYEEFIEIIEKILSREKGANTKKYFDELNLAYAKIFISAPDDVVRTIIRDVKDEFIADKRGPTYLAIRKDLVGKTEIKADDLKYFSEKSKK